MAVESRIKLNVNDQSVQTAIKNLAQMKTLITSFSGGDVAIQLNAQKIAMQQARIEEIQNRARIREENADNQRYLKKQETEAKISALNEQSALKLEQLQIKNQISQNNMIASERKNVIELQKKQAQLEKINLQLENYKDKTTNATTKTNLFSNALKSIGLVGAFKILQTLATKMSTIMQSSADYYENVNLFNIVMRESNTEGEKLIQTLSNLFGLDESNLYRYMASFKGMANNMGIAEKQAYTMSSALTKMTLDLSALYNVSESDAFESLSSAITGQVKSIRDRFAGIDVSEKSLSMQLSYMGINDRTVSSLNYAEKSILRFLSIQRQASDAQGVYASEMMKPAQMLKLLGERVTKLARAIGQIFIPIMNKVLPYLMATVEVLTIIAKIIGNLIATLFGFDFDAFEEEGINKKTNNIKTGFDNATASVKAFKKQLQGFDVLNNLTTTTTSGSGSGVGGASIDPRLLNSISDWNMHLELASKKVKEITDNMLDWLGITGEVDEETGKVTYKLGKGHTNIKKIGELLAGATILGAIRKIVKYGEPIVTFLTKGDVLSKFGKALSLITSPLGVIVGIVGAIVGLIVYGYNKYPSFQKTVNSLLKSIKKFGSTMVDVFGDAWDVVEQFWKLIKPIIILSIDSLLPALQLLLGQISGSLTFLSYAIKGEFKEGWKEYKKIMGETVENTKKTKEDIMKNFSELANESWGTGKKTGDNYKKGVKESTAPSKWNTVFDGINKTIKDGLAKIDTVKSGEDASKGIYTGIEKDTNSSNRKSWWQKYRETFIFNINKAFVIKSPSRLLRDRTGVFISAGIFAGMNLNTQKNCQTYAKNFVTTFNASMKNNASNLQSGLDTINAQIQDQNYNSVISYKTVGLPDISAINGEIMANDMNIRQDINTSSLNQKIDNLSNAMTLMQSAILKDKNNTYTIPVYIGNEKIDEHQRNSQQRLDNMYGISR